MTNEKDIPIEYIKNQIIEIVQEISESRKKNFDDMLFKEEKTKTEQNNKFVVQIISIASLGLLQVGLTLANFLPSFLRILLGVFGCATVLADVGLLFVSVYFQTHSTKQLSNILREKFLYKKLDRYLKLAKQKGFNLAILPKANYLDLQVSEYDKNKELKWFVSQIEKAGLNYAYEMSSPLGKYADITLKRQFARAIFPGNIYQTKKSLKAEKNLKEFEPINRIKEEKIETEQIETQNKNEDIDIKIPEISTQRIRHSSLSNMFDDEYEPADKSTQTNDNSNLNM